MRNVIVAFALAGVVALLAVGAYRLLRGKAEAQLAAVVADRVASEIDEEQVAREAGLGWPVSAPTATKEQVEQTIDEHIREAVDREFGESRNLAKIIRDAEAKYRVYRVGERVSFRIRDGAGTYSLVEGALVAITDKKVHVSNRWIDRSDIDEATQARLYPSVSQRHIERYVQLTQAAIRQRQAQFEVALRRKVTRVFYMKSGYAEAPEGGGWVPREQAVAELVEQKRAAIEAEVFTEAGYEQKDGEWVKPPLSDKLRAAMRRLFAPPDSA